MKNDTVLCPGWPARRKQAKRPMAEGLGPLNAPLASTAIGRSPSEMPGIILFHERSPEKNERGSGTASKCREAIQLSE